MTSTVNSLMNTTVGKAVTSVGNAIGTAASKVGEGAVIVGEVAIGAIISFYTGIVGPTYIKEAGPVDTITPPPNSNQ
jgi:hypothetical protein